MTPIERIIAAAKREEGYLGKKTNEFLDDPLANPGGKWNKFARDLDALGDFYNGKKNGYDHCDIFVDWLFVTTFGRETAQKMIYQPNYSCGAGCGWSLKYYKNAGALFYSPQLGDQAFFGDYEKSYHTGLVVDVDNKGYVYIMEGNSGPRSMVQCCKYRIGGGIVTAYGRPNWALVPNDSNPPLTKEEEDDMIPTYKNFEDIPDYYQVAVKKAMDYGALLGTGKGELNVSEDLCRTLTVLDRLGQLEKKV